MLKYTLFNQHIPEECTMELRSLRYFIAVYEELSLTAASKRCFVAQPSISSAIQHLESELERQLFVRHPRGVTPTLAGNNLYPYAHKLLNDVETIKNLFNEQTPQIPLKLALMPFLSGQNISLIIKELLVTVKGLNLTIVDLGEEADLRIISSNMVEQNDAFHKLWHDEFVLALPVDHPFALLKSVPMEVLNNVPFISRQPCDVFDAWQFAVQKSNIHIDTKATVKTEEYALDLVAAGLGISVIPSHSIGLRSDIATCKVSNLKLERIVGLAYTKDHPLPDQLLTAIKNAKKLIANSLV
ncbi:MAG: LysR family transcriptional regulator [Geopsychrobacter sp.]|nr:LysR family transcriptional regulator [Geopsychrobacter sp.]